MICEESGQAADEVLKSLAKAGYDYSAHRDAIIEAFDEDILNGNNDSRVRCPGMKTILIIQEDHYDQHMDDDEDKPLWEDMVASVSHVPSYFWLEKK